MTTHTVTTTPLSIGGTASDNVGVTQVTWVNDRGGSGTATGTTELVGERHRAAVGTERADGDGARCGRQHQHRSVDRTAAQVSLGRTARVDSPGASAQNFDPFPVPA